MVDGPILILGASGYIGRALYRLLGAERKDFSVYGTSFSHSDSSFQSLDITDRQSARKLIEELNPAKIFLLSAMTNVSLCEKERDYALRLNAEAPEYLAEITKDSGTELCFFSSDLVFAGSDAEIYDERSAAKPVSYYGYTKAKAEEKLMDFDHVTIVRTSLNYGLGSPFLNWMFSQISKKELVTLFSDEFRNTIFVEDLCKALLPLCDQPMTPGLFQIAASTSVSRYDWAYRLFAALKDGPSYFSSLKKIRIADFQTARPGRIELSTEKYSQLYQIDLPDAHRSLSNFVNENGIHVNALFEQEDK